MCFPFYDREMFGFSMLANAPGGTLRVVDNVFTET